MSIACFACLAGLTSREALAAFGGPDGFGYYFIDQAHGTVYNYVDITATGVMLGNGDDVLVAAMNLGAPFTFYGNVVTQVRPSTNGFITSTTGTSSDFSNDCPLPIVAGGGGFRIAALHDDLISTVRYQYFDEVAAAGVGYPGETAGISVFQWNGEFFPAGGGDAVSFEAILFHDDFSILTMVEQDTNGGSSSTMGIQNGNASIGLNYTCNAAGDVIPGVTAVLYTLTPPMIPPDSDCCTASPTGTPGCLDAACEAAVCGIDPFCCDTAWDGICADESAQLCAICAMCGDGVVGVGEECDGDGMGLAGETATCDADCTAAACGDMVVNATAGEACDDGMETATCNVDCTAAMCGDTVVNTTAGETCDDGGRSATCNADCTAVSCGDGVLNAAAGEECDDAGESATCDADCTNSMCGDGLANATAGEECDDAGESKGCDDDCTLATCGDGTLNATAGEECDDGNTDDGDGCSVDCMEEAEPGSTGGDESTGTDTGLETGADETAGTSGNADTGATSMGPGPDTLSAGDDDSSGGRDTDTDTSGVLPPTDGCSCSTPEPGGGRGMPWSVLALLGLGALRRRRRS
ncbi:MYXO-CTERM sorting domain-containing protein [Paraliomyxa miuraensis]|uniref:MYXO-CTERM sorting domain-containing protein n=1 Tax=Paraliomyxa miuraensis TaxID=376150 RepID=UPI00225530C7|nr:MYXO-CTERM sorting domain-containing protein [Paraliomyxa miuraensis]MCX4246071.1 MYXO-CTERM sorting domain-containing protein [Paraliomyxa miuraensis]